MDDARRSRRKRTTRWSRTITFDYIAEIVVPPPRSDNANFGRDTGGRHPDDDDQADKYLVAGRVLGAAGLRSYEISNWAQPGRECRHNLVYWHAEPYLGLGAGAHSFFLGRRMANVDAPNRYVEAVNESWEERRATGHGELRQVAGGETPDEATTRADTMILGLRLMRGVDIAEFTVELSPT